MKIKKNKVYFFIILVIISAAALVLCTFFGAANISIKETLMILLNKMFGLFADQVSGMGTKPVIIWQLRFPRTLLAFIVGGVLAMCGGVYEAIFKNPMADPYILGISSGAAFGATIAMFFKLADNFLGINTISLCAFVCGVATIFLVYNIARVGRRTNLTSLLLTGTAFSQFLTAIISLIMMLSSHEMRKIYFWTLGSFSAKSWNHVLAVLPYAVIGCALILMHCRDLDIIMLGDDSALRFGVETEKVKRNLFFVTALMMAACVSVSGIIGFVGLVSPHVVRLFTGPIHKKLMPASFLTGGIIMMFCDTVARSVINSEIPVGIVTALIGAPFFVYLLRSKRNEVM
jgi:iron complex transport system permease protein